MSDTANGPAPSDPSHAGLVRRHVRVGWWTICLFLVLGSVLEALHGFKVDWYLAVSNETRRLMWRLAHAHGVLVGVLNVVFALTLRLGASGAGGWRRFASQCLTAATVLLPGGFLLGGIVVHAGDPGRGVLLVPFGAVLLIAAAIVTATKAPRGI